MIQSIYYPRERVQRVSCKKILRPTISHSWITVWMWSRHVPQLSRPVAFSTGVVAVAGSAIITTTILDTTTTTSQTPAARPYNSLLRLPPASAEQTSYSPKSAPTTCCDARDTTLRPPINTTPGSALTPSALSIVLESRLRAIFYEGSLDLIFNKHRSRAGKNNQERLLDMLIGQ